MGAGYCCFGKSTSKREEKLRTTRQIAPELFSGLLGSLRGRFRRHSAGVSILRGITKPEPEVAVVTRGTAVWADLEHPAQEEFERSPPAGFIDGGTAAIRTKVARIQRQNELHAFTRAWGASLARNHQPIKP